MSGVKLRLVVALAGAVALGAASSAVAANYTESTNGDLSGTPSSPTPWALTAGANVLTGDAGDRLVATEPEEVFFDDYDLVALTVPAAHTLNSITVVSFTIEDRAFLGLQEGSPWNDALGYNMGGANLIGWTHIGRNPPNELLGLMLDNGMVTPLRTAPLAAGVYTMVLQNPDDRFDYSLSFNVASTSPPIPGDFDGNRTVQGADLTKWRGEFHQNGGSDADADMDSDGNDFLIWQKQLGVSIPVVAIPEPAAGTLTALAVAAIASRRRRRNR